MPLSSSARLHCRDFLEPREQIRYAFPATSVTVSGTLGMAPFIIVVSQRWITALGCGLLRREHHPVSVWERYPRTVRFGPLDCRLAPTFTLGDLMLEIDEEYVSVVRAANLELTPGEGLPPDPLPEL